ncbi:MAG TPA: RsmD family RNA methyltransferase, partial [Methylocella sp.]|nr:RsmD family RNA methyltransferase [Methylocella sp.]
AFLDPPYGRGFVTPALTALCDGGFLAPGALILIEESTATKLSIPDNFIVRDMRQFGETQILFVTFEPL